MRGSTGITIFPESSLPFSSSLLVTAVPLLISHESRWTLNRGNECVTNLTLFSHAPFSPSESTGIWMLPKSVATAYANRLQRRCGLDRWGLKAVPHVNPRQSGKGQSTRSCAGLCKATLRGYQAWGRKRRGKALSPMDTGYSTVPALLFPSS